MKKFLLILLLPLVFSFGKQESAPPQCIEVNIFLAFPQADPSVTRVLIYWIPENGVAKNLILSTPDGYVEIIPGSGSGTYDKLIPFSPTVTLRAYTGPNKCYEKTIAL